MPIVCLSRAGTDSFESLGAAVFSTCPDRTHLRVRQRPEPAPDDVGAKVTVRSIPASGFGDGYEDGQRRRGAPK